MFVCSKSFGSSVTLIICNVECGGAHIGESEILRRASAANILITECKAARGQANGTLQEQGAADQVELANPLEISGTQIHNGRTAWRQHDKRSLKGAVAVAQQQLDTIGAGRRARRG